MKTFVHLKNYNGELWYNKYHDFDTIPRVNELFTFAIDEDVFKVLAVLHLPSSALHRFEIYAEKVDFTQFISNL